MTGQIRAAMFEQANEDPELMKSVVNRALGEPFEEDHDAPEWERLYERAEDYAIGTVPEGGLFLTAGVGIQRDRIEADIAGNSGTSGLDLPTHDGRR